MPEEDGIDGTMPSLPWIGWDSWALTPDDEALGVTERPPEIQTHAKIHQERSFLTGPPPASLTKLDNLKVNP